MAKLMSCVAWALVESVTMSCGMYVPWPPISELLIAPVDELIVIPSGSGGLLELVLMLNVYGGVPPLAVIVHPAYAAPCVPPGQVVVVIFSPLVDPPPDDTVTLAVAVFEPEAFVAVSV